MYVNKDWKWVVCEDDYLCHTDTVYRLEYRLRRVSSFRIWTYPNARTINSWTLSINSNSKIQKWIISRLNINQTRYKSLKFEEGELEQFLDELDLMMELLYGK